jgi:hypothetical protein
MLLKAVGQTLGTAKSVWNNCWGMSKGNHKLLGNSERVKESGWEIPNTRCQPIGEEAELSSVHWQKHGNSVHFH